VTRLVQAAVFIGWAAARNSLPAGSAPLSQELLAAGGTAQGGHTNVRLTGTAVRTVTLFPAINKNATRETLIL